MNNIYFLIILLIIFSSCQKNKEKKINGKWQFVYLTNSTNTQIWNFNSDKNIYRTITTDSSVTDTANWKIDTKIFSKSNLLISNFKDSLNNGVYEVLTLNKNILIIQRISFLNGTTDAAFNRIEFVKYK